MEGSVKAWLAHLELRGHALPPHLLSDCKVGHDLRNALRESCYAKWKRKQRSKAMQLNCEVGHAGTHQSASAVRSDL